MKDSEYKYLRYKRDSNGDVKTHSYGLPDPAPVDAFLSAIGENDEIFHISEKEIILRQKRDTSDDVI